MASTTPSPAFLEQDRSNMIVDTTITFIVLITVAYLGRIFSRRLQKIGYMWSDLFMFCSLISNLGLCTATLLAVRYGAGHHIVSVSKSDLITFTILSYYCIPLIYSLAVTFPKLAVLDLYLNIFIDKVSRYTSYGVGLVLILNLVVNVITVLLQCEPFDQTLNPVPGGHCDNISAHFVWASFPNIITDVIILALPVPVIWRMHTTWQRKLGLSFTFFVGGLGLATSTARFILFWRYSWYNAHPDPTWDTIYTLVFTALEACVYHLAACFVILWPLLRWLGNDSPVSSLLSRTFLVSRRTPSRTSSDSSNPELNTHRLPKSRVREGFA